MREMAFSALPAFLSENQPTFLTTNPHFLYFAHNLDARQYTKQMPSDYTKE
jgi:hypothetical protein